MEHTSKIKSEPYSRVLNCVQFKTDPSVGSMPIRIMNPTRSTDIWATTKKSVVLVVNCIHFSKLGKPWEISRHICMANKKAITREIGLTCNREMDDMTSDRSG